MENFNKFNQSKIMSELKKTAAQNIVLKLFDKIDSTNEQAKKYVLSNNNELNKIIKDRVVVFAADFQLAGRGRRGSDWFSDDPASIAVSFLFKPEANIDKIPQITAAAALAVKDTFEFFDLETSLKWPNDILVSDKKICGILSELVLNKRKEAFVIIGCGINLNNKKFGSRIEKIATSYLQEKNIKIDKNLFLARLIEQIRFYIINYLNDRREMIIGLWKKTLDLAGKKIDFTHKNEKQTGVIKKIMDNGDLSVLLADGQEIKLQSYNTSLDYQSLKKYNNCSQEGAKNEF